MAPPASHDLPGLDDDPSPPLRPLVWFLPPGLPHTAAMDLYPRPGKISILEVLGNLIFSLSSGP